ncbi:hypothetical protein DS2_09452 [Catenovulum agarivorans DS-2]|uniref:Adenylate cyclase n=1 Tax=Catenovulum agarivorans DS-2 TaxID=1328313 RepID=W7QE04_9ALTE|nr:CYTH domain-containing protein [Catenovulum agarivorans]EWH10161.1 hypothetical protein DS2_09452 [Catenovulum agarivorans DS-2]
METEIELKFAVASETEQDSESVLTQIKALVEPWLQNQGYSQKHLSNIYFDTPEQTLRAFDCGLRIRSVDNQAEQTLKTAGICVGGLHKRPEYNIAIEQRHPDLSLFPAQAWPEQFDWQDAQENLIALFSTEFVRHKWRIQIEQCQIEVVYDLGEVDAQGNKVAIHEIEIELIDGDMRALFALAHKLTDKLPLRLSNDSKAARGYRLFLNQTNQIKPNLGVVDLTADMDVEQAFSNSIQHGLGYWQYHEELFANQGDLKAVRHVQRGVWLVRHTFWLFRNHIPKKASTEIRKELKWLSKQFDWLDYALHVKQLTSKKGQFRKKVADDEKLLSYLEQKVVVEDCVARAQALFYSARYNALILKLMLWLTERGWRCYSEIDEQALQQNICGVARQLNQNSWIKIQRLMPLKASYSATDYIQMERSIGRALLTGVCMGSLFAEEERLDFRAPWLDIMQGIADLKTLFTFKLCIELYPEENRPELEVWADAKINSLVNIMEQSRQSALRMEPYWH